MTILDKYITKEIIRYFSMVMGAMSVIFIAVDFIERIDNFLEKSVPITRFFFYMTLKMPFIIAQLLPISVLIAILLVFGLMIKNNELIALKSSGVSVNILSRAPILIGLCASILLFIISEAIMPLTMIKANYIWYNEVKNNSAMTTKEKDIWIKGKNAITHIGFYEPKEKIIHRVKIHTFDQEFRLIEKIDAQTGYYVGQEDTSHKWRLVDIVYQTLENDNKSFNVTYPEERIISIEFSPDDLHRIRRKSNEMSFIELREYIHKLKREGFDVTSYQVDLFTKISFPFVCLIMSIVGVCFSIKRNQRSGQGISGSVVIGIATAFSYWVIHSICLSLGYTGNIPPLVAAWLTNILFACMGGILLLNAD